MTACLPLAAFPQKLPAKTACALIRLYMCTCVHLSKIKNVERNHLGNKKELNLPHWSIAASPFTSGKPGFAGHRHITTGVPMQNTKSFIL